MTWNPIKLRRMVDDARGVEIGLRCCIRNLGNEMSEQAARIAGLSAELDRLKNLPRGKNEKFCGGRG